ncbi:MAG: LOG family protein [Alphaproteobacteria bacterium]
MKNDVSENKQRPSLKAYQDPTFLNSRDARALRILAEYLEPEARFDRLNVKDTIVFLGSARTLPEDDAQAALESAKAGGGDTEQAEMQLRMSHYYGEARELARRLTEWSKGLEGRERRFVICTGGGPGIMEAANRGASEAKGLNVGLTISLPAQEFANTYVTRRLSLHFHYFFMRKFWFTYLAKAIIVMPGGFGTLDEFFEVLTLLQTLKIKKRMPIVLFGTAFWDDIVNFEGLARYGMIDKDDLEFMRRTDSVDEAFEFITGELTKHALESPGASL